MDEHIQVGPVPEGGAHPLNDGLVALQVGLIRIGPAAGGIIVPDVEDAVLRLRQDEVPAGLPQQERPLPPGEPGELHDGKGLLQQIGEPPVLHLERRAEELVLPGKAFVDVGFVELCFGGNGLGGGFLDAVPGRDADRAFQEGPPHVLYFQFGAPLGEISNHLFHLGKEGRAPVRPAVLPLAGKIFRGVRPSAKSRRFPPEKPASPAIFPAGDTEV